MVVVPILMVPSAKTIKVLVVDFEPTLNIAVVAPVEEENTDRPPCEDIPPEPTNKDFPAKDVLAIILPCAKMSFLDCKFPTSAECAIRLVTSVPEISTTEIVSSRFPVYA